MSEQIQQVAPERVHALLHTRPEGLGPREVQERLEQVGPNRLEAPQRLRWLAMLARQFSNFFTILLGIAAAICFVADHVQPGEGMNVLGWALFAVAVLNALFSFAQEYRAERAMEELKKFLPVRVRTRRGGETQEVAADALVPGDVILVREGDRVPADARLVEAEGVLVSNAPLTGESRAVALQAGACEAEAAESTNLLFAGCTVLRGTGTAVVFATGFRTEFGKIASLSHRIRRTVSPLERETARMVRVLTVIAVTMGLAFFAWGVVADRPLWVNLVFMLGIIVANVPEGLLPTFTLSLAMASLRMARGNVLVKGLNAVEALGSVHVVCTDKTGTLTQNRLSVGCVVDPVQGEALDAERDARCLRLALIASALERSGGHWSGDPLDVCLAEYHEASGGGVAAPVEGGALRFAFDAELRRSGGAGAEAGAPVFAVKGAWEALRPLLGSVEAAAGEPVPADAARLAAAGEVVSRMGRDGYRVIALAWRPLAQPPAAELSRESLERELVLAGFIGLEDPLRPEVPEAVARCHTAGIRVIMITGDHPETAETVARRAGILAADRAPGSPTVSGAELARMRESQLMERLEQGAAVFARTTPEQKMKIVSALHELDRVVAVTGDGVNDAPALKAADVGIAMGASGTDVAREAAQVILLDDNFASITAGIAEGRTIFANIGKFTNYVLVSNGPEIIPYLLYILLPVPLALTVIQILCIDLGTDIVPSMGLGQEPPEPDVMQRPPRERRAGLLSWPLIAHSYLFLGLIEAGFALGLFFWVLDAGGWEYGQALAGDDPLYRSATGITLSAIMLMQIGNLAGRRSRYGSGLDRGLLRNPFMVCGILLEAAFSWALLYWPPLAAVLGTGPVAAQVYAAAWLGVPLIFGLDWLRKQAARALAG